MSCQIIYLKPQKLETKITDLQVLFLDYFLLPPKGCHAEYTEAQG